MDKETREYFIQFLNDMVKHDYFYLIDQPDSMLRQMSVYFFESCLKQTANKT